MSNIDPPAGWPDVDGIDTFERLLGGVYPASPMNRPVSNLTARTKFLRNALESFSTSAGSAQVGFIAGGVGATPQSVQSVLRNFITPENYGATGDGVADDYAACQAALDAGAGRTVTFTPGKTYRITSALQISSDTTLVAFGATVLRGAAIDNMIRNKADGVAGGYDAARHIRILGGTWDGNGPLAGTYGPCTAIAFGHITNVRVAEAIITNIPHWHHIELNSTNNAKVINCAFYGGAEWNVDTGEAIQLDHASNSTSFPWFGPYDGTPCDDITITGCSFVSNSAGVGTHSPPGNGRHQNILIEDNTFHGAYAYGVRMYQWADVRIINNRFQSIYTAIYAQSQGSNVCSDVLIQDNTFIAIGDSPRAGTDGRCIHITGASSSARYKNVRIINNTIPGMSAAHGNHAIGCDFVDNIVVSGNVVENPIATGVYLYGCNGGTVSGNVTTGAPSAGANYDIKIGFAAAQASLINVSGNTANLMGINNATRCAIRGNIINTSVVQGGTITQCTVGDNLVAGVLT